MKALVLNAWGGPLKRIDRPLPDPGPGEVLLRVKACGVGLTLTNIRQGRLKNTPHASLPRVLGHEVAGEVVRAGPGVRDCPPGTRGVVYFYLTCGACEACTGGHDPLCHNLHGLVGIARDGGLAEYMTIPASNLIPLPPDVDDIAATAAADAMATPWHAFTTVARVQPLEDVVIIGAGGGVGVHAVQIAKLLQARVTAVDISPEKLRLAEAYGADALIHAAEEDVAARIRKITGGKGADVVVDYVSNEETLRAGYQSLAKRGRLLPQGVNPPGTMFRAEPREMFLKEIAVMGSRYAAKRELRQVIELVRRGLLRPVVTRTGGLEDAESFFEMLDHRTLLGRAAVVFA